MDALTGGRVGGASTEVTVLHVDDDPAFAEVTAEFLERESDRLAVDCVTGAEEGLRHLRESDVDCVVSDYEMPGTDGIDFLEAVREEYPDLPFILFTGKGSEEVASEAISAGADDYLQKGRGRERYTLLANRVLNYVESARTRLEHRRRLDAIETANEGIATLEADGTLSYANAAFADLFGRDPEDLVGEDWLVLYPEDRHEFADRELFPTAAETGAWSGEVTGRRADGSTFLADFSLSATDGGGFICTVRDITDDRRRKRDLERFETVLEGLGDPVYTLDAEGRFTYVNEAYADLTGYDRAEMIGEHTSLVLDEESVARGTEVIRGLLSGDDDRRTYETTVETADGERVRCEDHVSLLPTEDGQYRGAAGVVRDVSARTERIRQLEALHVATRELIAAEDPALLASIGAEATRDILGLSVNAVYRHDPDRGVLEPLSATAEARETFDGLPTFDRGEGLAWEAFESGEPIVHDDVGEAEGAYNPETPVGSELLAPLGEFGVLVAGTLDTGGFDDQSVRLARVLAANMEAALDRAASYRELQERERKLTDLQHRIAEIVEATSPGAVAEAAVDIARAELGLSLCGIHLREGHRLAPAAVTPAVEETFEEVPVYRRSDPDRTADRVNWAAFMTGETVVIDDVRTEPGIEADETATRSGVTRPLGEHGVFILSSPEPDAVTETDLALIEVLGTVVTAALDRLDREQDIRRFERIVEAAGDPVYTLDADGRYTYVNDALTEMVGYEAEEMLGEHPSLVLGEADVAASEALVEDLHRGDRDRGTIELDLETADGETLVTETQIALLTGPDGTVQGTVGVARDITERKRRERELERYETIIEALPVGVFIIDEEGTLVDGNELAAGMVGETRERWLGESFTGLIEQGVVPESAVGAYERTVAELLSEGADNGVAGFETEIHPGDGGRRVVRVRFALLPHEEEFRGTVGVFQDITDQRERQAQLEEKNERLEEFAGVVSHDLRNPLSVASGRLELARIALEDGDTAEADDYLAAVADAHDRMERLIEDLLALAREGAAVSEFESVALAELSERCWGTVDTRRGSLAVETDRQVRGDPDRLRQLFENLFRNAAEHGGPAVSVEVGACEDGFYVADDGPGIPESDHEAAFEAGYSTSEDGTGFGLAIVEEIADAHGWEVRVAESGSGGARFEFATDPAEP